MKKEEQLLDVQVVEGSLIVSPMVTKEHNIEMFNNWIKETYL